MTTTLDPRAARRERVRQMCATGASARTIAKELHVSKDTVRRDLAHLAQQPDQQDAPGGASPSPTRRAPRGHRAAAGADAVRQLADAVAQVAHADLPHLIIPSAEGRRWTAELRAQAGRLAAIAEALARYYPDETP
jgi:predicted ArsR family transcriptional regulator